MIMWKVKINNLFKIKETLKMNHLKIYTIKLNSCKLKKTIYKD